MSQDFGSDDSASPGHLTAIVTGASAGIGRAVAARFAADGARVFNLSRRPCDVAGVTSIPCDLSDPDLTASALAALDATIGSDGLVCLVHNAAQMRKDQADDCDSADLAAVLQTNVVAVNQLNQHLLARMTPGSSILYIGSTLAEKAVAGTFSYVISKHALLGMMRATCQDLAGRGIHTACICPGFTDTEMLREHLGNDEAVLQAIGAMNAFGRLVDPAEIADLVAFAHGNPAINGAVLHANLGQKES